MKNTHNTLVRVRYGETDQMGYVYYGNYASYFEIGRVELLRSIGVSYKQLEDSGIMLPVSDMEIKYKKPAFYDDELTVKTSILETRGPRIVFIYKITKNDQIIIEGKTTLVFVSKENMRPIKPPKYIEEILNNNTMAND
jgi:acyl-CoA thioester hydrolase